jgi:hypothetical protein
VSEAYVGPGHMVSSMVAFGVGILVLLSAGIFLAHVIAAYRAETRGVEAPRAWSPAAIRRPVGQQPKPPQSVYDLLTRIDCKFRRLYSSMGRLAMWFDLLVAALVYGAVKWLTYLQ